MPTYIYISCLLYLHQRQLYQFPGITEVIDFLLAHFCILFIIVDEVIVLRKLVTIFILVVFFSCASEGFRHSERREGFSGTSLRVYVRDADSAKETDDENLKKAEKKLMNLAARRGSVLLAGFILTKVDLSSREVLMRLDRSVKDILSKGKLIHIEKLDDYTEAFVDYDTGMLLKDIEVISDLQKKTERKNLEGIK